MLHELDDSAAPILAAVDIGSNTIKLTVARTDANGRLVELLNDAQTVRLGADMNEAGQLNPTRVDRALACLHDFRQAAQQVGAGFYFGVATEALRRATDAEALIRRIKRTLGWQIDIISGEQEARLTFEGLRPIIVDDQTALIADIGGGSTELIWTERGELIRFHSLPIGSGRLTDDLVFTDPPTRAELDACRESVATHLRSLAAIPEQRPDRLLVTGGTGVYLADLIGLRTGIQLAQIHLVLDRLSRISSAILADRLRVTDERARVLPAGIAAVAAIVQALQPALVTATESGLRRGLLLRAFAQRADTQLSGSSSLDASRLDGARRSVSPPKREE